MKYLIVLLLGLSVAWGAAVPSKDLTSQELIDHINGNTNLWTAGEYERNYRHALMDLSYIVLPADTPILSSNETAVILEKIPESFDSRKKWEHCHTIGQIRDQSDCGDCWAFGAAEAISDRTCIHSNDKFNEPISADDLAGCCGKECGDGCKGGFPIRAWQYWVHHGLVTGGNWGSKQGCKPYSIEPCGSHDGHFYRNCPNGGDRTPKCEKKCQNGHDYEKDKHFGKSAYQVPNNQEHIMSEILEHGPVEAAFTVYEDFEKYKGGIYHHVSGKELGGHAVKILGWGKDKNEEYWLVANSWNNDWGEKGFFRIRKGHNECGIEGGIVAGIPH